jgi:hypothetical protein
MGDLYWWSRYGNFSPGKGILPHMGEVIAQYRKRRGYETQGMFAIAAGVNLRAIQEWEAAMMTHDHERREFLAKLLKIPPALLGLDWRLISYQDNTGSHENSFDQVPELVEEDVYYHYEDTLTLAWGWFYSGRLLEIADRFERRLQKLENKIQYVPEYEKEAWKELLCKYYHFSAHITRHRSMDNEHKRQALRLNAGALKLAREIEDHELTALLVFNRATIQDEQEHYTQAKAMARAAIDYAQQIRVQTPLYGTIHLMAATILAPHTANDEKLATEIRGWLDKTLRIVYKGNIEPDRTFLKLNLAAVHHDRAKAFLQFHRLHSDRGYLKDAESEMKLAWQAFTPDLAEWKLYLYLTDARILEAEHEVQGSVYAGLEALKASKAMHSKKREMQIRKLYYDLINVDPKNPYVHNFGLELGIFH